jgi:hypothetical protein
LTTRVPVARFRRDAGIAQLVECKLPKLDVAGSTPVARSNPVVNATRAAIPGFLLSSVLFYNEFKWIKS